MRDPVISAPAPAMSSLSLPIDCPTVVHVCTECSHAQSPNIPDLKKFYDTDYRISLQSDDHDQLYETVAGNVVFRTDKQADLLIEAGVSRAARVLDFGSGKAVTLQKLVAKRDDVEPHVFDVSRDYLDYWKSWIPEHNQATYELPDRWDSFFDIVATHFVLEHVADPVGILKDIKRVLKPGGMVFFIVPNPLSNAGDLLVADHINHFTHISIERCLFLAGYGEISIAADLFRGAYVVTAKSIEEPKSKDRRAVKETVDALHSSAAFWVSALKQLDSKLASFGEAPAAIYGAGFYGSLIAGRLRGKAICFIDSNPYVQGGNHMGIPIVAPASTPDDIEFIVAGLNPAIAREVLYPDLEWIQGNPELVFLD